MIGKLWIIGLGFILVILVAYLITPGLWTVPLLVSLSAFGYGAGFGLFAGAVMTGKEVRR